MTPKQISNLRKDIEDPSQLDGYDELPEDFQEKVANALEQGHVDDEDWGWVLIHYSWSIYVLLTRCRTLR